MLQRGNQRKPDRIAIDDHDGGIIDVAQRRIRDRFQPGNLVALDQIVGRVRTRCTEAGREWTPRSPLQRGQARIRRDAIEPGPERRLAFVTFEPAPSPDERLLDLVFGVVNRPHHAIAVRQQLAAVRIGKSEEITVQRLIDCHLFRLVAERPKHRRRREFDQAGA